MRQRTTTAVGLVVAAGLFTGCGPGEVACTTIGYSHSLEVTLEGDTSTVAEVRYCEDDAGCWPDPGAAAEHDAGIVGEVTQRGGTWIFVLWGTPDTATIQVRDHADDVVAEADVPVDWVQVDGTPECGGPHEGTAVVVL